MERSRHRAARAEGRTALPGSGWRSRGEARRGRSTRSALSGLSTRRVDGLDLNHLHIYVGVSAGAFICANLANDLTTAQMCRAIVSSRAGRAPVRAGDLLHPGVPRGGPQRPGGAAAVRRIALGVDHPPPRPHPARIADPALGGAAGGDLRQPADPRLSREDLQPQGADGRLPPPRQAPDGGGGGPRLRPGRALRRAGDGPRADLARRGRQLGPPRPLLAGRDRRPALRGRRPAQDPARLGGAGGRGPTC